MVNYITESSGRNCNLSKTATVKQTYTFINIHVSRIPDNWMEVKEPRVNKKILKKIFSIVVKKFQCQTIIAGTVSHDK